MTARLGFETDYSKIIAIRHIKTVPIIREAGIIIGAMVSGQN